MRLNKFVATATGLSRRTADTAISDGRVTVNGVVAALGHVVADGAHVALDGSGIKLPETFRYVMLNKPKGVVVSRVSQDAAATVYALMPPELAGLKPVGRLDKDSTGLLLLTDDGDFANASAHPSSGKLKTYEVGLDRKPSPAQLMELARGVTLDDGISRLEVVGGRGSEVIVRLAEGRNRQVRRTFEALGLTVKRLHRTRFGRMSLPHDLASGGLLELPGRPEL